MKFKTLFLTGIFYFLFLFLINNPALCQENKVAEHYKCPIDGEDIPDFEHKIGLLVGKDSDYTAHYSDGLPPHKVFACKKCSFAGPQEWFNLHFSESIKEFFAKDNFAKMRFIRDIGREPDINIYADRCALTYYSSYIIFLSQKQRYNYALKASAAYRNISRNIDEQRNVILDFCRIKILAGVLTPNFDFDIIGKSEKLMKEQTLAPIDSVRIYYAISILFRYHGENPRALFYIKNIENLLNTLQPEAKKDYAKKTEDLFNSIQTEQEFQRYALSAASLALRNKEISFFDLPVFFYSMAEINRRLNNMESAKKYYLLAQKFCIPEKSDFIDSVNVQGALVGIEINPQNTPKIYQIVFLMLALLLYGYIELEGKTAKEFNEWRRKYYFKRSSVMLLIAAFLCFQSSKVFATNLTSQVAFLLSAVFAVLSVYVIRANLKDDKYFPIIRERRIPLNVWGSLFADIKMRLKEKLFDINPFENLDESKNKIHITTTKTHLTIKDHIKVKLNIEIEKTEKEVFLRGELIPLQPIVLPEADIKNLRRLFRYILGEGKEMPKVIATPLILYFLIPLILIFTAIRILVIFKPELMIHLPHSFFVTFPLFIAAGLLINFIQYLFKRKYYSGFFLSVFTLVAWFFSVYLSIYILQMFGI